MVLVCACKANNSSVIIQQTWVTIAIWHDSFSLNIWVALSFFLSFCLYVCLSFFLSFFASFFLILFGSPEVLVSIAASLRHPNLKSSDRSSVHNVVHWFIRPITYLFIFYFWYCYFIYCVDLLAEFGIWILISSKIVINLLIRYINPRLQMQFIDFLSDNFFLNMNIMKLLLNL